MKIQGVYTFREEYIPPRCRKPRSRQADGVLSVTIKEVSGVDAPIAIITTTNEWRKVKSSKHNNGIDLIPVRTPYRWYKDKLYVPYIDRHGEILTVSDVEYAIKEDSYPYDATEKERIKCIRKNAKRFLIIDDEIYVKKGEPRYCINTFGIGFNNGGTGFFVENHYNRNISKNNYFNALERDKAIKYGRSIALGRGDTKSVDFIGERCDIEVFIPEAVKCNPQKEHSEGCSFINEAESMITNAGSVIEAGLGVMALGLSRMATVYHE